MSCNHNLSEDPEVALKTGNFVLLNRVTQPYYNEYYLKCKICNTNFKVNDHLEYHYNYWSWHDYVNSNLSNEQIISSLDAQAELEIGAYRIAESIWFDDKVLVLDFPYNLSQDEISIIFKAELQNCYGLLILHANNRQTKSKVYFAQSEFNAVFSKLTNRSAVPHKNLINKDKFDVYYQDLFKQQYYL